MSGCKASGYSRTQIIPTQGMVPPPNAAPTLIFSTMSTAGMVGMQGRSPSRPTINQETRTGAPDRAVPSRMTCGPPSKAPKPSNQWLAFSSAAAWLGRSSGTPSRTAQDKGKRLQWMTGFRKTNVPGAGTIPFGSGIGSAFYLFMTIGPSTPSTESHIEQLTASLPCQRRRLDNPRRPPAAFFRRRRAAFLRHVAQRQPPFSMKYCRYSRP